jgi:hypothetical protein
VNVSQDFLEKVGLLVLTALVTGFAAPFILKRIEERKARDQKRFDADLARQAKLIDAQVTLIENFARLIWEFQLSLINVTYYRGMNPDMYDQARRSYDERSAMMLRSIRAEISKSIRLVPAAMYGDLKALYYDELLVLDSRLSEIQKGNYDTPATRGAWQALNHYAVYELSEKVDALTDRLASTLGLKAASDTVA